MRDLSRLLLSLLAIVLMLWLIFAFWPLSDGNRVVLSLCVLLVGGVTLWRQWCRHQQRRAVDIRVTENSLPPEDYQGAVVLVGGDSASLFSSSAPYRETRQGWYLRAENAEQLPLLAQHLAAERPALVSQISVLLAVVPEQHTSTECFTQMLRGWHRSIIQCRTWLNGLPPVWSVAWITPPANGDENPAIWFTVTPELPGVRVRQNGHVAMPVTDWQQESGEPTSLRITLWLNSVMAITIRDITRLFSTRQSELPPLNFCATGVCLTAVTGVADSLWQRQLADITTLTPEQRQTSELLPLPDVLLPSVPGRHGISRRMQNTGLAGGVCFVFLMLALLASFINNQRLIRSVSDHLALYHHLSGTPSEPKVQAQQHLRQDSRLLDDWLRRGEPLRYGLGLYQGMRLIPPIELALTDWAPPSPVQATIKTVIQGPQTVRLDALSLFDTGQWQLKPGSTKVLVNALVNIKAKAGWLIVVSGHTDSTGEVQANQQLSLKRAESVRNWMRDTGDVPESCFAVQGYGATRPLETNDTVQGRAANRRVEISLVPQADACRMPGTGTVATAGDPVNQK
ncbi:OmpA family protein [Citrobacter werkmanii]|uniref:OmpA family protein n=1 Tax=Citrobacter werkmanii TaxID=67827 RepID=UPI00190294A2|nr:OmpA family protein [Citrobacter werkmanii]MBJ9294373.1 OmpA family protein [Citrobacter werkmanii]